jgi:hypothetical protein
VSLKKILVLLVLVAALGTYLFVYELPQAEKEGKKEKLLQVEKDAVAAIVLVYPDREIELSRSEAGWRVAKPVDVPADEAAVKSLLTTIADAEVQRTLDEMPQDLASFGLDKPTVTVTLRMKDGAQPPPVAVGKNTAIGGRTYVRKGDEPKIHLTTSSLQFGLNKQVKDLRDKQLLVFQDDDVTRVEIQPAGRTPTTLVRADKDSWKVEPGAYPADATEVRSYLASLRGARATDFPDDSPADLAKYGLDRPRLTVTVATGKDGGESRTLLLGAESTAGSQKQVYAKRGDQPTVYALGEWSFRGLDKTAGQFRDKTVLGFDPARVGKVVLEREGAAVTLVRADGSWRVEGAEEGKKPNLGAITRFLDDVRELRGSDIAAEPAKDLAPFGLDHPEVRITLTDTEGQAMGSVLAAKHDGKHYVMRSGGSTVFEARDYMYTRLDRQPKDFVETAAGGGEAAAPAPAEPEAAADGAESDADEDLEEE